MRRTMKKLLLLPVMALTFGMVACESNPTAPALQAPAAPSADLRGLGLVIEKDSLVIEFEAMGALPPPPPPKGGYDLGWP
jgi:hypothetical protein